MRRRRKISADFPVQSARGWLFALMLLSVPVMELTAQVNTAYFMMAGRQELSLAEIDRIASQAVVIQAAVLTPA